MRLTNVRIEKPGMTYHQQQEIKGYRQYKSSPLFVTKQSDGKYQLENCDFYADVVPDEDDQFPVRIALYIWNQPIETWVKQHDTSIHIPVRGYATPDPDYYCAFEKQVIFHAIIGNAAGLCVVPLPFSTP